jgi:hypothetical protein
LTPRLLGHLDETPDFSLDQVAQVVMDRWSSGRVGLLGDAAFSSSPLSGLDTEPSLAPEEWDLELIERAINGIELPGYAGVPGSGSLAGPSITSGGNADA